MKTTAEEVVTVQEGTVSVEQEVEGGGERSGSEPRTRRSDSPVGKFTGEGRETVSRSWERQKV